MSLSIEKKKDLASLGIRICGEGMTVLSQPSNFRVQQLFAHTFPLLQAEFKKNKGPFSQFATLVKEKYNLEVIPFTEGNNPPSFTISDESLISYSKDNSAKTGHSE